jgi:hypothetical protein
MEQLIERIRGWMRDHPQDGLGPRYDEDDLFILVANEVLAAYERGKVVGAEQALNADLAHTRDLVIARGGRQSWVKPSTI